MTRERYDDTDERRQMILRAAAELARDEGLLMLSQVAVAKRAGCSRQLVAHYFGNPAALREAVAQYAVDFGDLPLVAQGLISGCRAARRAPRELRAAALKSYL